MFSSASFIEIFVFMGIICYMKTVVDTNPEETHNKHFTFVEFKKQNRNIIFASVYEPSSM